MKHVKLFQELIDDFDPYGNEHGERVSKLSMRLAEHAGIKHDAQAMVNIKIAGLLHDVGKIRVPQEILRNKGRYLNVELEFMRKHVTFGANMIAMVVNGLIQNEVVEIVRYHHERWSGNGYLEHLKGEEIPYGARVLGIVDSYDAITHERGYIAAMTKEQALDKLQLEQEQEQLYDPALFQCFLDMMKEK